MPGSRVPRGPQLVLCALGVLSGGAVPEALPRGPRRLGRLVTGRVQGPHRCPGDRLCSAPERFLRRRLPRALIAGGRPCGDWRRFRQQAGGALGSASCLQLPSSAWASYAPSRFCPQTRLVVVLPCAECPRAPSLTVSLFPAPGHHQPSSVTTLRLPPALLFSSGFGVLLIWSSFLGLTTDSGFPGGASDYKLAFQCRKYKRLVSIPGSGRSPGAGHGDPLQHPCLENSLDRGVWRAIVHRIAKRWTRQQ